jgi:hypothetical protein
MNAEEGTPAKQPKGPFATAFDPLHPRQPRFIFLTSY